MKINIESDEVLTEIRIQFKPLLSGWEAFDCEECNELEREAARHKNQQLELGTDA